MERGTELSHKILHINILHTQPQFNPKGYQKTIEGTRQRRLQGCPRRFLTIMGKISYSQ